MPKKVSLRTMLRIRQVYARGHPSSFLHVKFLARVSFSSLMNLSLQSGKRFQLLRSRKRNFARHTLAGGPTGGLTLPRDSLGHVFICCTPFLTCLYVNLRWNVVTMPLAFKSASTPSRARSRWRESLSGMNPRSPCPSRCGFGRCTCWLTSQRESLPA